MQVSFTPNGIHLPELDLWLDGADGCAFNWISHGHSDHARGSHGRVLGTAPTLDFFTMRGGQAGTAHAIEFGESIDFHGARLTAHPASHILGAAQLLVEYKNERLVYTGDIKLRKPLLGETTAIVPCDRLIIESTFGLPIFRFLDCDEACERIVGTARECLAEGVTPVFLGYPLGRGQEIVHALCAAGIPVGVHGAIARYIPVYERAGYRFPGWTPYDSRATEGKALVVVQGMTRYIEASGRSCVVAYVSGWAALANARTRAGADELIPYSDHADFGELLTLIDRSGAREVDVVHGYPEPFARILQQRGIEARAPQALAARAPEEESAG